MQSQLTACIESKVFIVESLIKSGTLIGAVDMFGLVRLIEYAGKSSDDDIFNFIKELK